MNKEQAKDLLPIIQAYVEGKTIESRCIKGDTSLWYDDNNPSFDEDFEYRIKPEPKYRLFKNTEECFEEMKKHQPFGWIKDINHQYFNIITLSGDTATTFQYDEVEYYEYQRLMNKYTFADGSTFGIKE